GSLNTRDAVASDTSACCATVVSVAAISPPCAWLNRPCKCVRADFAQGFQIACQTTIPGRTVTLLTIESGAFSAPAPDLEGASMDQGTIRRLSDEATETLLNKSGTAASSRGGWMMIATILIEAWDL